MAKVLKLKGTSFDLDLWSSMFVWRDFGSGNLQNFGDDVHNVFTSPCETSIGDWALPQLIL